MSAARTCTGPCGRTLPRDAEHFYRQQGGDGLTVRCKECIKAATAERKAAARERRAVSRLKRCTGPCGRTLPAAAENFARDPLDRPRPRCRECELAAELAREVERELAAAARERVAAARERAAAKRELPLPPEPPRPPCGFADDRPARLRLIQRRAELTPRDPTAAADRARRIMRAADAAVEAATRPPFDAHEVLLEMAEDAEDVAALGRALRLQGWTP